MSYQLKPGTELDGRYIIEQVLGQGGFGITYKGVNKRVGLTVAIKELYWKDYVVRDSDISTMLSIPDEENRKRFQAEKAKFLEEARIMGDFTDEKGIVNVIDYFEANDTAYIVMEFLEGVTLKQYVRTNGRMTGESIFKMLSPILDTLEKIHEFGLIHRDVSPENIMITQDYSVKLLDFGSARDYMQDDNSAFTVLLKKGFAPVEQYNKNGKQGPWSDIYALCSTVYYCIVGSAPDNAFQRVLHDELKSPSELGIEMDERLETILMKGLSVDSNDRYQSVKELQADLDKLLKGEEKETQQEIKKSHKSNKKIMYAGMGILLICVVGVVGVWGIKEYRDRNKFGGITTETVYLTPDSEMSVQEYKKAKKVIEDRLAIIVGKNNYEMEDADGYLKIVTPLDMYEDMDISYVYDNYISDATKMRLFFY